METVHPHEAWFMTDEAFAVLCARHAPSEPSQERTRPDDAIRRPERVFSACPVCGGDDSPGFCLRCEVHADLSREGLYPSILRLCVEIQEVGYTSQDGTKIGPWTADMRENRNQYQAEPIRHDPIAPTLFYDDGGWESTRL